MRRREARRQERGAKKTVRAAEAPKKKKTIDGAVARPRPPLLLFAFVSIVLLVTYRLLSQSVSGFGDSSEFTLVLATNGVPHPTGYPLFVFSGHIFAKLMNAAGMEWSIAAASWSHLGAAVAVFFLQLLAWQLTSFLVGIPSRIRIGCALAVAIVFAFNPIWLEQATLAEVYSWHIAWVCVATSLFVALMMRSTAAGRRLTQSDLLSAASWGLIVGLGFAHHRSSLLLAAPYTLLLLVQTVRVGGLPRALGSLGVGIGSAVIPLLSYGFTAWGAFHPGLIHWPALEPNWTSIYQHISGEIYWGYVGYFAPNLNAQKLLFSWAYPFLAMGLAGLISGMFLTRLTTLRLVFASLAAGAALATIVAFRYGVSDSQTYFLMPLAIALAGLAPFLAAMLSSARVPVVMRYGLGLMVLGVLGWTGYSGVQSRMAAREVILTNDGLARQMWEALPIDEGILFWPSDAHRRFREYQILAGEKPNLYVMNPSLLGYPMVQREFQARFGFDPLEGFDFEGGESGQAEDSEKIRKAMRDLVLHVNARTPLPVIYMEPEAGIAQQLPKPPSPESAP